MNAEPPVLWHLKVSHYNEKARWALDHKRVPHVRRAVMPGRHDRVARRLSGGSTLPVLVIDGKGIGDSTAIIAELERRHPEPPLYPVDPTERERALELEDFFDEELGAPSRLLTVHHTLPEAGLWLGTFMPDLDGARLMAARASFPMLRPRLNSLFGIDDDSVARAFDKVRESGDRFRSTVGPSGYLVGDTFSVADLTLAALVAPLVAPEQFPYPQPQRGHPRFEPVREALDESGLVEWTRDIYARHRGSSAEVSASA
jgi:glutathione S-transferase